MTPSSSRPQPPHLPMHASARACRLLALALASAAWMAPAFAQAPTASGDIEHQIVPGDTLEALARHYLDDTRQWPALARLNQVRNPRHLQPGSTLRIPQDWLPFAPATVHYVQGQVQASLPDGSTAAALAPGQSLPEGTRVQVPRDGFVSVRLHDGSIIRVQADSRLHLQRLRKRARPGTAQSVIELQHGEVQPSVPPATDGARRLDIRTPKATASVRGTRFTVSTTEDGRTLTAVREGRVAVQGTHGARQQALLPRGQGVAVDAGGALGTPAPLLPAPDLSRLPATVHDADFLRLNLPAAAGAHAYQVQVARDAELTEVVRAATTATPALTLPAVEDGRYQIAVRLLDASGLPGYTARHALTVKAHPIAPLYQAPGKDATVQAGAVRLECTRVAEARRYRIQVAAQADFAQPLLDATSDGDCAASTPELASGRYVWRVASLRQLPDGQWDQGPYAAPQGFAVAPKALAAEVLRIHASASGGTTLSWPARPGQRFRLQLTDGADFTQPLLVDRILNEPVWPVGELPPGSYRVRIRTIDASGLESAYSTPYAFSMVSRVRSGDGQAITTGDNSPLQRP